MATVLFVCLQPHGLNLRSVEVGRLACTERAAVSCRMAELAPGRSITFFLTGRHGPAP